MVCCGVRGGVRARVSTDRLLNLQLLLNFAQELAFWTGGDAT